MIANEIPQVGGQHTELSQDGKIFPFLEGSVMIGGAGLLKELYHFAPELPELCKRANLSSMV